MKFTDCYIHEINTDLRPLESVFKSLHAQNPSRQLDLPHEVASCRDILLKASQTTSDPLPSLLATTLNEDSFSTKIWTAKFISTSAIFRAPGTNMHFWKSSA